MDVGDYSAVHRHLLNPAPTCLPSSYYAQASDRGGLFESSCPSLSTRDVFCRGNVENSSGGLQSVNDIPVRDWDTVRQ